MLAARGVSLGLGRINLSELNQLPAPDRALLFRVERQKKKERDLASLRHKLVVRKYVDKKTLWAACRTVIIGAVIIVIGLAMTVIGYFDKDFTTTITRNSTLGVTVEVVDNSLRYRLKSMQYVGPVLMGVGAFLLIIACVITLESRDRHAQIIQDKSAQLQAAASQLSATPPPAATKRDASASLGGADALRCQPAAAAEEVRSASCVPIMEAPSSEATRSVGSEIGPQIHQIGTRNP